MDRGIYSRLRNNTSDSSAKGLGLCLCRLFATFGVPEELSSDGGSQFTAGETRNLLQRWGVRHRISSAHHLKSNGRAEVSVKATKPLLNGNVGANGDQNTDTLLRAMLTLRNSSDPDCRLSTAQILFGRPLGDAMPSVQESSPTFNNPLIHPMWRDAWNSEESALRSRYARTIESLGEHARPLNPLQLGDRVYLQNQVGNHPKQWDRGGTVVECRPFNLYVIKVDGTGQLTVRNRMYLRRFEPHSLNNSVPHSPSYAPSCVERTMLTDVSPRTPIESPILETDSSPTEDSDTPPTPPSVIEHREPDCPNLNPDHEHWVLRSTRVQKPRLIYDPVSGYYTKPRS